MSTERDGRAEKTLDLADAVKAEAANHGEPLGESAAPQAADAAEAAE